MENMNIAFFTEAGTTRGMGHLVRSHTISKKFKSYGLKTFFFLDSDMDFSDKFDDLISFSWSDFKLNNDYDIIFIDSYEANLDIYKTISLSTKIAVYIDDFARLAYPKGIIFNFLPDSMEEFFKQEHDKYTYFIGLDYLPIRDEFLHVKFIKKKQIFIMLGGNDTKNLLLSIITSLKNINIDKVVVTNDKQIASKLSQFNKVKILYKPKDKELIENMSSSSWAISTASMSLYELSYLRIPTIIIATETNQEIGAIQFIKYNLAISYISIKHNNWLSDIEDEVNILINSNLMIKQSIDGKGTQRIFDNITRLIK